MRLAYAPKLLRSRLYLTPYRLRLQGIDLKFYRKPQPWAQGAIKFKLAPLGLFGYVA